MKKDSVESKKISNQSGKMESSGATLSLFKSRSYLNGELESEPSLKLIKFSDKKPSSLKETP
jgi:hypothetical protein